MRPKRTRGGPAEVNPFAPWISILYDTDNGIATLKTEEQFSRKRLRVVNEDGKLVETKDHHGWWLGRIIAEAGKINFSRFLAKVNQVIFTRQRNRMRAKSK